MLRLFSKHVGSSLRKSPAARAAPSMLSTPVWQTPSSSLLARAFASAPIDDVSWLRNIGISAHIDSGKTTLTERILYYTGRINAIHDVRGKDGVGAKMDSMELEREKGITIQSAATYCSWGDHRINIIDTPGHVDFTVEVERALRVLDGAILVLCSVGGVQSQTLTVDRQMHRYNVPRICFINKLDRIGADPFKVIKELHAKIRLNAHAMQLPIGVEDQHQGVIDLIERKAYGFEGSSGESQTEMPVPEDMKDKMEEMRTQLVEALAEVDEEIEEMFLMEEEPTNEQLHAAVRRATIARKFAPVFMGSAFKNKGVQPLLNAVVEYLPNPTEVYTNALDRDKDEEEVLLRPSSDLPLVALAFKLEESRFGQLTYMRVYQGELKRGDTVFNIDRNQKVKVPRLVRMHSNEMEDIDRVGPGEIVAMFGIDCHSGDTFTDGKVKYALTSMHVPEPVISYSIKCKNSKDMPNFSKALNRFMKEDPTFRVNVDSETKQTIMSGMGELHLDIYVERMRREYKVDVEVGEPRVNYRETIRARGEFNYLHKKQSGGAGQFGRVIGYVEPLDPNSETRFEFVNNVLGNNIPPEYIAACKKGFEEAMEKGPQLGVNVQGVRVVLTDGQAHSVDSSELAFKIASSHALRQGLMNASPVILEPTMSVEVSGPNEFQGTVVGLLNKRKGQLVGSDADDLFCRVLADVPLSSMFGFSTDLRSATQGKCEFSMEYKEHAPVMHDTAERLMAEHKKAQEEKNQ